ncbi:hypothetical protein Tco_0642267 [Tanacetum coccineum]
MSLQRRGVKTEIIRILAGQVTTLAAMADVSFFRSLVCKTIWSTLLKKHDDVGFLMSKFWDEMLDWSLLNGRLARTIGESSSSSSLSSVALKHGSEKFIAIL